MPSVFDAGLLRSSDSESLLRFTRATRVETEIDKQIKLADWNGGIRQACRTSAYCGAKHTVRSGSAANGVGAKGPGPFFRDRYRLEQSAGEAVEKSNYVSSLTKIGVLQPVIHEASSSVR